MASKLVLTKAPANTGKIVKGMCIFIDNRVWNTTVAIYFLGLL
jgi:hypothetical protein